MVTREGQVHHRELMCRIFDGNEEVSSAEYMPMVLQFGLSEEYDRLQISRLIPLLRYWPEENLAIQVTVESLIRPRFQRWLRDTLMQCEKSQRKRIIIELAEADVGQHISRLQPVIRLVNALGGTGSRQPGWFDAGVKPVGSKNLMLSYSSSIRAGQKH